MPTDYERLLAPQIEFLLKDAKEASARGDSKAVRFSLLQIFKLSARFHETRPPTAAETRAVMKGAAELGMDMLTIARAIDDIYREFGEAPPSEKRRQR